MIMGLSSSGPSQTLAVSFAGLVAVSGYGGGAAHFHLLCADDRHRDRLSAPESLGSKRGRHVHLGREGVSSVSGIFVGMDDPSLLHLGTTTLTIAGMIIELLAPPYR